MGAQLNRCPAIRNRGQWFVLYRNLSDRILRNVAGFRGYQSDRFANVDNFVIREDKRRDALWQRGIGKLQWQSL